MALGMCCKAATSLVWRAVTGRSGRCECWYSRCGIEWSLDHGVLVTTLLGAGDAIATIQQSLACQGDIWKQVESGMY
jgi:hypothetical protein|eukprot:3617243-Prymnesium_polylepis.1